MKVRIRTYNPDKVQKHNMQPITCNLPLEDIIQLNIGGEWFKDVPADEVTAYSIEEHDDGAQVPHGAFYHNDWFMVARAPGYWFPKHKFYLVTGKIKREMSKIDAKAVLRAIYNKRS